MKKHGRRTRKLYEKNLIKVIKEIAIPFNDLGIKKSSIGLERSGSSQKIPSPKSGKSEKVKTIIKSSKKWTPPIIDIDTGLYASNTKKTSSMGKYSVTKPVIEMNPVPSMPSYVLPPMQLNISTQYRYPYLNLAA